MLEPIAIERADRGKLVTKYRELQEQGDEHEGKLQSDIAQEASTRQADISELRELAKMIAAKNDELQEQQDLETERVSKRAHHLVSAVEQRSWAPRAR